ncbi:hypothetical protein M422DRAFT_52959 [Sphaerobolus stellatus SS14]|uniref:Uncharacterized protein n=1 Tax=Sphaerobolus stellatus (strain SS14) TaxID=990650 RepID=A0A0C9UC84_SPHS4|nr:hypothetical protein M422DRAFT_52959 [Sphaerobolus stellatus SS14]
MESRPTGETKDNEKQQKILVWLLRAVEDEREALAVSRGNDQRRRDEEEREPHTLVRKHGPFKLEDTTNFEDTMGVKVDAMDVKVDTMVIKFDAMLVKLDTMLVKLDMNRAQIDANTVKLDTNGVKLNAMTVKLDTNGVKLSMMAVVQVDTMAGAAGQECAVKLESKQESPVIKIVSTAL